MKTKDWYIIILVLLGLLILTTKISESVQNMDKTQEQIREERELEDAAFYAFRLVKQRLKAPSTAKFPPSRNARVLPRPDEIYRVSSYVDSQNSFGAFIRTHFIADIKYNPNDEVILVNVEFNTN